MTNFEADKERLLLAQASTGNERAFALLLAPYQDNLFTTFLRMTGDQHVAEELLQDSFLKVWLKREQLPEILNFGGWLYTIAANIGYNYLDSFKREKTRAMNFVQSSLSQTHHQPEDRALEKEYARLLQRAIERLSPKQKETYQLIKQEGMRREEAARVMGVSPETVKWNLDQAMRNIRAFCMAQADLLTFVFLWLYSIS